jgi:hypothetical protein
MEVLRCRNRAAPRLRSGRRNAEATDPLHTRDAVALFVRTAAHGFARIVCLVVATACAVSIAVEPDDFDVCRRAAPMVGCARSDLVFEARRATTDCHQSDSSENAIHHRANVGQPR